MKKILPLLALSALVNNALAADAPPASDLVGRFYGGLHGLYIDSDSDRQLTDSPLSSLDDGYGVGIELGRRFTEALELRLAYTDLDMEVQRPGFTKPDMYMVAADMLYFPDQQNVYLLAGVNHMSMQDRRMSMNVGAGYRYYLSDSFALYGEGKGYYDLGQDYTDFSVGVGMTYFFGSAKHKVMPKAEPAPAAMVDVDSDHDGVVDRLDQCADSAMGYRVDAKGCTIYKDEQVTMDLLIHFANDKADVASSDYAQIQRLADFMKQYPQATVEIAGHTSQLGKAEYNLQLSQRRADAVAKILIEQMGIAASRVQAKGYGETRLLDTAMSKEAHQKNRRTEANIVTSRKVAVKQ